MKRFWFIAPITASCFLFTMAACEHGGIVIEQRQPPPVYYAPAPAPYPAPAAYTYYYYPDSEVYFEPAAQFYFWFDGGSWHRDHNLPRAFDLNRERHVSVQLNTDRPWTMHERVRSEHPGHTHTRND